MFDVFEKEHEERPIPESKHFVYLALLPAFAVSLPYGFLLWQEAIDQNYDFWSREGRDIVLLLVAPFIGYCCSSFFVCSQKKRFQNWAPLYWSVISIVGSFTALAVALTYFYFVGPFHVSWKTALWNTFLFGSGLSLYTSIFTAVYFYAVVSRSMKRTDAPKKDY